MKHIRLIILALAVIAMLPSSGYAEGAGIEWDILNDEVLKLLRAGKYERGVVVAKEALKVARENVDSDHPYVATSLNNLAALYRATKRSAEAQKLEVRAARINAIPR